MMDAKIDETGVFKIKVEELHLINNLNYLLKGIHMAVIARDEEKQKIIAGSPESLWKLDTPSNSFVYFLVMLVRQYFHTGVFNDELYQLAQDDIDNYKMQITPKIGDMHWQYHMNPYLLSLKSLIDNNEPEFNKNLLAALTTHKEVWGQKKPLRGGTIAMCRDNNGFLSWGCTALAAMAHDKGWKLEIESDYMPVHMVTGSINN
jgi:hypothetical protein